MRLKIGLFGMVVNVVVVTGIVLFSAGTREGISFSVYVPALLMLAISAFVVYYYIVSAYVAKRAGIQKPLFIDSLVGMLAELIIVTLGAVCYSVWISLINMRGQSLSVIASDITASILVNLLWVFAMFTLHIFIVGNIAGLAGWYLMSKIDPKSRS